MGSPHDSLQHLLMGLWALGFVLLAVGIFRSTPAGPTGAGGGTELHR